MDVRPPLTAELTAGHDLPAAAMAAAAGALAEPGVPDVQKEAFLVALTTKGESPAEIAANPLVIEAYLGHKRKHA